jgi:hypothetical protein
MVQEYKKMIADGCSYQDISIQCNMSISSVKRLFKKLNLKTKTKRHPPVNILYDELKSLVDKQCSSYGIANKLKTSQTNVRYWLKKWGLKLKSNYHSLNVIDGKKQCTKCQEWKSTSQFYISKKTSRIHSWCKLCNNTITYEKQCKRKKDAVDYKGGRCYVCGYSKYMGSLEFHHLIPSEKEFNISNLRTYSHEILKKELDKCICVCRNCHAEIHGGLVDTTELK